MNKKKIAFICVHNSCRSQIAEALGKHLASDAFDDNWGLEDPTGKSDEEFIKIIKQIEKNILELKENINVTEEKFSGKYDYMPQLFSIDLKDYELNYKVFSRPSARAIILDKNTN